MSSYRQQAPAPVPAGGVGPAARIDEDYDYGGGRSNRRPANSAVSASATSPASYGNKSGSAATSPSDSAVAGRSVDGDEALMDLVQLEELHVEAEKMKALGNKHMAAQEYTRAYNAYSAALQLSPVGPSSHVFLSNRAAALLSLKRYNAAATDARRAVALAPTFGKAHARLGQALYFLKDYAGAVAAYEDAIHYEPDNQVTRTYLEKARSKLEKHRARAAAAAAANGGGGDGMSLATSEASTTHHYTPSIATDPHFRSGVVQSQYRGDVAPLAAAVNNSSNAANNNNNSGGRSPNNSLLNNSSMTHGTGGGGDDPDFDEALRIQNRANQYLANKEYKAAIEEYTAALFLVPDDPVLSPDLHLGRAHALNGSRRHERAKNDAHLAIRLAPSPAAYSTLAKSLFYLKEYRAAIAAFQECTNLLPPGEALGMFDKAYMQKAEAALEEEEASLRQAGQMNRSTMSTGTTASIPKLPPPRFVPREEAMQTTPNLPPMRKDWPQQSPRAPPTFRCGPERNVAFLSESLGIKLNRGSDGIVRVLWVQPEQPGSTLARQGHIAVGDVIREVGGVDIRRPITNIMWGDTVALVKMAPRPIAFIVAKELSEAPAAVLDEIRKANEASDGNSASNNGGGGGGGGVLRPSPANGEEESVRDLVASGSAGVTAETPPPPATTTSQQQVSPPPTANVDSTTDSAGVVEEEEENTTATTIPSSSAAVAVADDSDAPSDNDSNNNAAADTEPSSIVTTTGTEQPPELPPPTDDGTSVGAPSADVVVAADAACCSTAEADSDSVVQKAKVEGGEREEEDEDAVKASQAETGTGDSAVVVADDVVDEPTQDGVAAEPDAEEQDQGESLVADDETSKDASPEPAADQGPAVAGMVPDRALLDEDESEPDKSLLDDDEDESEPVVVDLPTAPDAEERAIGGEILFERTSPLTYSGWDQLRWLSYSGIRKVRYCQPCFRLMESETKQLFWSRTGQSYEPRFLAIYSEPNLILVLRRPSSQEEVHDLLGLPPDIAGTGTDEAENAIDNFLVVESVADPSFCKLRLSPLTTPTSAAPEGADERRQSCLEVMTPSESILLSTVRVRSSIKRSERSFTDSGAFLETSATETALTKAICGAHDQAGDIGELGVDISFKHQLILGSLHSLVVSGDAKALDEAIAEASARVKAAGEDSTLLPARIIDEVDDNGLTPLYYACARRMVLAATSLVSAGARVDTRIGTMDVTLGHVCCLRLDHKTLSTVLSVTSDPNACDALGRTPMYLAATEGRTVSGGTDPIALGRCIMALEAWGGKMTVPDPLGPLQSAASILAGNWSPEELAVVLDHTNFRYPLRDDGSEDGEDVTMSLTALFQYPLHRALVSLKSYVGQVDIDDDAAPESRLVRTLRVLLERSFEPNERLEPQAGDLFWSDEYYGFTPIQVLAAVALEIEATKGDISEASYDRIKTLINSTAEFLERNGARIAVDAPPARRLRRLESVSKSTGSSDCEEKELCEGTSKLRSASKKVLIKALGGNERLKSAEKEWNELQAVPASANADLLKDDKASFSETDAPGGNSEKSCAICWQEFGPLMNRKHRCRITRRFVCDSCSGKRIIADGVEYRVTDGQFLLARVDSAKEENERSQALAEQERVQALDAERVRSQTQTRSEKLDADDQAKRDSLFGNMLERGKKMLGGEEEETAAQASSAKAEGLTSSLNETRNALIERGKKLESMGEKSSQLVDASSDFARMAKELRKKTESKGIFW